MTGETDINKLIKNLDPQLNTGEYVFVVIPSLEFIPREEILGMFNEKEGVTVIINRKAADQLDLNYEGVWAWITLNVHSSLSAIGLTAIVSQELASHGISCNIVAGYYHDHIFVVIDKSEIALKVLSDLSD